MLYFIASKPFYHSSSRYFNVRNSVGAARTLAFSERNHAQSFRDYLVAYRREFCTWPYIDASRKHYYDGQRCANKKHHSKESISRHVHVIGWDIDEHIVSATNANILTGVHFTYDADTYNFTLKGYDATTISEPSKFRFTLEHII